MAADPTALVMVNLFAIRACIHPPGTLEVLVKVVGNILDNPSESKFRALKKTNARIRSTIVDVKGAGELLVALGFVETADSYLLPEGLSFPSVVKTLIQEELSTFSASSSSSAVAAPISEERKAELERLKKERDAKALEKERLIALTRLDQEERRAKAAMMGPAKASIAVSRSFGHSPTTYKDIGVDLNKKSG